jgi:hypothetical protein
MNLLNDKTDFNLSTKTEMELVEQEKQEFRLLGTYLRTPGLFLYCYNPHKEVVEEAFFLKSKNCVLVIDDNEKDWTVEPHERERLEVNPNWDYFEALNIGSARRRVERWKTGKLDSLWNLRMPSRLGSIKLF